MQFTHAASNHCSCLQGDPAYNEQAQMKEGQGLTLTLTLWDQDCVVTVDELSKLPLPKLCKLYTVCGSCCYGYKRCCCRSRCWPHCTVWPEQLHSRQGIEANGLCCLLVHSAAY